MNRVFNVADYYVNTAKYAKNCVNKARPQLHCNGQCQLMKKLKALEEKEKKNPEQKPENKSEGPLSSKTFYGSIVLPEPEIKPDVKCPVHPNSKTVDRSFDIFHPPRA